MIAAGQPGGGFTRMCVPRAAQLHRMEAPLT
jgi:hypothetical protein